MEVVGKVDGDVEEVRREALLLLLALPSLLRLVSYDSEWEWT